MLASRMFQTALKLLFATGSVLLATVLLMAYVPVVASSVPIFGYAAVVLCFQPRVEATVDQVRTQQPWSVMVGVCYRALLCLRSDQWGSNYLVCLPLGCFRAYTGC